MNNKSEEFTLCKEGAGMGVITSFRCLDNGSLGGSIRLTIAKSECGNASFSFTVSEWAGIKDSFLSLLTSEFLSSSFNTEEKEESKDSPCYQVIITRFNKTAAEIISEEGEEGLNKLLNQYSFLKDNLQKYRRNIYQMEAIEEAKELYQKGKLNLENVGKKSLEKKLEIYRSIKGSCQNPMKGNPDYFLCSSGTISYTFSKNYPINISIENFYAKIIRKENGSQIIDVKSIYPGTKNALEYNISKSDFSGLLDQVETSKLIFLIGNAKELLLRKEEMKTEVRSEFGKDSGEFFLSLVGNFEEHDKLYSCRVHVVDSPFEVPSEMTLRIWKTGRDLSWVDSFFSKENIRNRQSLIIKAKIREDNLDFIERVG